MDAIRMILTHGEYASFAEAEPNAVSEIHDGDPLWLYIRFPGPAAGYARRDSEVRDERGRPLLMFTLGIGPLDTSQEDWQDSTWYYLEGELQGSEIIRNLSPGVPGRNRSENLLVHVVANGAEGYWENSLRLSVMENWEKKLLAECPVTVDVSDGMDSYTQIARRFVELTSRGTAEENKLPLAGTFVDLATQELALAGVRNKGVEPEKFYWSSDAWMMTFRDSLPDWNTVDGVVLYRRDGAPMYGTVQVATHYSPLTETWSPPQAASVNLDRPITEDAFNSAANVLAGREVAGEPEVAERAAPPPPPPPSSAPEEPAVPEVVAPEAVTVEVVAEPGVVAPEVVVPEAADHEVAGYRLRLLPDGTAEITIPVGGSLIVRRT